MIDSDLDIVRGNSGKKASVEEAVFGCSSNSIGIQLKDLRFMNTFLSLYGFLRRFKSLTFYMQLISRSKTKVKDRYMCM